jgi:tetratricopeptide (TPR) repeat protein
MPSPPRATRAIASASRHSGHSRISQLWQLPLLLVSLGLFGYAAYLFIDPQPGPSVDERIASARKFLDQERPDAANALLNRILTGEKLTPEQQGRVHLFIAESIDMGQRHRKISVPANYVNIIEQTRQAMSRGAQLDANAYRRIGEAYEALRKPAEALDNYRRAMNLDTTHALRLQRKVIDLQLAQDDTGPAEMSLDEYLKNASLTDAERAWAYGQKAQILSDNGKFVDARALLDEAVKLATDPIAQGEVNYRLGYCEYKLNDAEEAERYLRVCRELLKTQHPLDADAAYLLGRIYQEKGDATTATSFYEIVLVSHIDSKVAPLARLGRGTGRIMSGQDDAGLTDLHDLVEELAAKPARPKLNEQTIAGLQQATQILTNRQNLQGALELMAYEQSLRGDPPAGFFARLGSVYEKRADQLERSLPSLAQADRIRTEQQVRETRTRAGDAYVAYSRKLTLADDKGYGEALWKGIDLYDRAANVQCVISALDLFVAERPDDPLAPDALLKLGRAYQAAGLFDRAIDTFQRNQVRYPKSLAASKSAVPLAQAYIAKGPDAYGKAETVLIAVVDNNPLITPEAEEFKQALFDLAQLYYRTARYEEAVSRLEEFTKRYADDERTGQLLFLMADSYRKSASLLDARLATADARNDGAGVVDPVAAAAAKRERLLKARGLYDKVIDLYRDRAPTRPIDHLYLKLAHFYRADCLYDLGEYAEAIKLYDAAAFKYQEDPSALAAYVQIVNSYCALGKVQDAKTANERAKWLLRRMPAEAFSDGTFSMPKEYWAQWLKWTSETGMW